MSPGVRAEAERNVRLYPWYTAAGRFHCSVAVFYLFLGEHLTLERLLQLEAVYYVAFVMLEVPSGYLSDRVGRRLTLLISGSAAALGFGLFSLGSSFAVFAAAQVLVAVGWTFRSGTDTTLHYDSLVSAGLADEYGAREAAAQRNALVGAAAAAILGGVLGSFALRAAYVATFFAMLIPLALVIAMREPPRHEPGVAPPGFVRQLRLCAGFLSDGSLRWLALFFVAMYVLAHVPYQFYQPYLAALFEQHRATPLATGLHAGLALGIGALGAANAVRVRRRIGIRSALLLAMALQTLLIGLMSLAVHPVVGVLILLRSTAPSLVDVLLNAEVTPRIPQAQRATYLSAQSLAGRLLFAGLLLTLSALAGERDPRDSVIVRELLAASLAFGAAALAALTAARRAVRSSA